MSKVSIENLSDAELDAYLTHQEELRCCPPTPEQKDGGAPRGQSIVMLVSGLLGMFASFELLEAEKELLANPGGQLSCDINPIVGCGTFLQSSANTLFFGISNAVFGLAFFSGIVALGLVLLARGKFGIWLWRLIDVAMVGAFAWLLWFWHTAFFVERGLCPYCMVVWLATIPLVCTVLGRSAQARHYPIPDGVRRVLFRGRWWITAGIYLALVILAAVVFRDQWLAMVSA